MKVPKPKPDSPHYFSRRSPRDSAPRELKTENDAGAGAREASFQEAGPNAAPNSPRWIEARVRRDEERVLRLATSAGTFARSGLDEGSALLLETVRLPMGQIFDLGCGWGALGCFCAAFSPSSRVWMCDINYDAVRLARGNARENDLTNVVAWRGDGAQAARPDFFDMVLCNPPIRAGNAVIAQLFGDAQRVLRTRGELWIVIRTAQGAKSWQRRLQDQFGNCETVAIRGGYRILKCVK